MRRLLACAFLSLSTVAFAAAGGCSSKDAPAPTGPTGGPVSGPADTHCGTLKQATSDAACRPTTDAGVDAPSDAAPSDAASDAGDEAGGGDPGDEYGATLFNAEGEDDQCKYHASFTSDPIRRDTGVFFTVTAETLVGGKPILAAKPRAEVFLDDTHPAPNTDQVPVAVADGVYKVGPIRFDAAGKWTVRFHFYEDCFDGSESPHGHIAFFVNVP